MSTDSVLSAARNVHRAICLADADDFGGADAKAAHVRFADEAARILRPGYPDYFSADAFCTFLQKQCSKEFDLAMEFMSRLYTQLGLGDQGTWEQFERVLFDTPADYAARQARKQCERAASYPVGTFFRYDADTAALALCLSPAGTKSV